MNRRSVIKAVSSIGIVGGTLFSTGAFESVEATRSVSVQTNGDDSALLSLTGTNNDVIETSGSPGQIEITPSNLNQNSITRFTDVLKATNNGNSSTDLWVDEDASDADVMNVIDVQYTDSDGTSSIDASGVNSGNAPDAAINLETGDANSKTFDLKFDLKNNDPPTGDLVFVAGKKL